MVKKSLKIFLTGVVVLTLTAFFLYAVLGKTEDSITVENSEPQQHVGAIPEQIESGDYSNVKTHDGRSLEEADIALTVPTDLNEYSKRVEWATCYLNENGLKGLILQEKEYANQAYKVKRIIRIFAFKSDEARFVWESVHSQMTEIYFLSKNGNFIYTYYFGGVIPESEYWYYIYDDEWNRKLVYALEVFSVDKWVREDDYYDNQHPDMPEVGLYFKKYTPKDESVVNRSLRYEELQEESLDEERFIKLFEEMTGYYFYDEAIYPFEIYY